MGIILASASPRRLEILNKHGIEPLVMPSRADESLPFGIGMREAVEMLARRKAESCYEEIRGDRDLEDSLIIAADRYALAAGAVQAVGNRPAQGRQSDTFPKSAAWGCA
jgi:septum formation protein